MTEYALAPTTNWDAANSPYRTPRVMLEQSLLQAYRVRSNGTMRHLALLPLASTVRETAEWISDAIEMDGRSVESVARELHISTPTVRRFLESLELTEEVEAGEWDDLAFNAEGEPVFTRGLELTEADEQEESVEEILDLLDNPPTVADLIEADKVGAVAPRPARTRRPRRTDEELLAQNRARFAPKTTQAAEQAPVAASTPVAPVAAPAAPVGAPLAVCFCSGLGQHAPGAQGCKNAPVPAVARRSRSHG